MRPSRFLCAVLVTIAAALLLVPTTSQARWPMMGVQNSSGDPIATLAATWSHDTWHSACPQEKNHCSFASLISSSYYNIANFDPAVADASTGLCYTSPCKASGSGQWASDAAVNSSRINPGVISQAWAYSAAAKSSDGQLSCMTGGGHAAGADGSIYCINLVTAAQNILNTSGSSGGTWARSLPSGRMIDACAVPAYNSGCASAFPFTETIPAWVHVLSTPGPTAANEAFIEVESPGSLQQKMGNFATHSYFMSAFLPGHTFIPGGVFTVDYVSGACCVGGSFPYHVDTGLMDASAPIYIASGTSFGEPYGGTKNGLAQGYAGDGVGFPIAICGNGSAVSVNQGGGGATLLFLVQNPGTSGASITYTEATADVFNPPADMDAVCIADPVDPGHYGMFFQESPTTFVYFSNVDGITQQTCDTAGTNGVKCWENQAFNGTVPSNCATWSYSGLSGWGNEAVAYDSARGKIAYNQGDGHICEITLGSNPALWSVSELSVSPSGDIPANPDSCNLLPRMSYDAVHDLFIVDVCGGEWWYKP